MRVLLFANGELNLPPGGLSSLPAYHLVVAADGGAKHCLALGLTPDLLVGDMDSASSEQVAAFQAAGVELIRYPSRKDFTDLELALQHIQERGANEVLLLGGLGARWDQTLANLLLPASTRFSDLHIRILDGTSEIFLAKPGMPVELSGTIGDTLSLIPLHGNTTGITTSGLEYPLRQGELAFGSTTGISNVFTHAQASLVIASGLLLVVHTRKSLS